ncbi:cell division protein FtsW [Myroides marinus]|uniref:FtsW/RodA/SpoVE family cell cycle protein n=1 Tax=Myroides marinus TaxID=703342 RepID=UPI000741A7F7|nr:FtsW/RodA/SpoVE family cell cycle protein [Myroides marinus]KUF45474.1 cell division protein FtsW [Myroides marinus]
MKKLVAHLYGDKHIWTVIFLLALFSFVPVYSASTNLVYTVGTGKSTFSYLFKHFFHLSVGFTLLYLVHRLEYRYFRSIAILMMPVAIILLFFTLIQGKTIGGANASRWLDIGFVQIQPSAIAAIVLLAYVAQYLVSIQDKKVEFWPSALELWLPVVIVVGLILPANFSTAAIIFLMVVGLAFIGKYPWKYLLAIGFAGIAFVALFVLAAKTLPEGTMPNRVDTWISRIDRFANADEGGKDLYQVDNAKIAIASGGLFGKGPGKSIQKNFLPQSSSDFIYAIIVEEYGLLGGLTILFLYLYLFFRFLIAAHKAPTLFGKLLVIGLGIYFISQALINMGVAVSLLPTTGQTLPLISSGGTSIWMTCVSLGVILSVTKKEQEIQKQEMERLEEEERMQEELKRINEIRQEQGLAN